MLCSWHRVIANVTVVGVLWSAPVVLAADQPFLSMGDQPPFLRAVQAERGSTHRQFQIPTGLSIQALTTVGTKTVFAGSFGAGIFLSHDRGGSWVGANEGLTDPFILSLATTSDGTVYAGTFRGGVFRSRDGGKTWQSINQGLKRLQIKALLIARKRLYAGTGNGVYRYNESKGRWDIVATGLDNVLVHCVAAAADGTLYAGTSGKGLLQYKGKKAGWQRVSQGLVDHERLGENFIRVLTVDLDQTVYAGTFDGGVFRSTDAGKSWKPISRALPNDSIRGIVANKRGLFVATGRGIFMSVDQGRTWIPINEGLPELSIQSLVESAGDSLYAGTTAGAFRSDDNRTWASINKGLEGTMQPPFRMFR